MPNFNSGYVFNAKAEEHGFFWNGATYYLVINLHETLNAIDGLNLKLAKFILSEKLNFVYESIIQAAIFKETDDFSATDKSSLVTVFQIADNFGIQDELATLTVLAHLHEKVELVEQIKTLADIIVKDEIKVEDIPTVDAFFGLMDEYNLHDLSATLKVLMQIYDRFGMTDHDPRAAVSDFIVGVTDNYDKAYDWLLPFGLKIDWSSSTIQVMPEAELTTIEMPGIDGSIVEDSVYKDRLFKIVAFSEEGLTTKEKEELKSKITDILDSTKHKSKKLYVQATDVSFDVRYDGSLDTAEGPSFVKFSIPFRAGPYGYETFATELEGNGLIDNSGDAPLGVVHTISGPITSPSFSMGEITYTWVGTIQSGYSLVIDQNMMTCYIKDSFGKKVNALSKLSGNFQKIPPRSGIVLIADDETEPHIKTEWQAKVLW